MESLSYLDVLLPLLILVSGVVLGLLLERIALKYLRLFAERTKWVGDEIIISAFRGVPIFFGIVLGVYAAIQALATLLDVSENAWIIVTLNNVMAVVIIGALTILAARLGAGFTAAYTRRKSTFLPATSIISNIVQLFIYVAGILIILGEIGVEIAPIVTALGVGGLAVALALQDTLSNVFAGLYLIAARQIQPGDYIKLESGEEGYINDINWRSATVRTILNNMIIVPNAKLASAIVTNYHLPNPHMLVIVQGAVDYDSDLDLVERVTLEVARAALEESGAGIGQDPYLRLHTFGEFSLNFSVVMPVREFFDQYLLRHVFMKKLLARYKAEGIRIPFPIKEFEMQLSTGGLETREEPGLRPSDAMEPFVDEKAMMRKANPGGSNTLSE